MMGRCSFITIKFRFPDAFVMTVILDGNNLTIYELERAALDGATIEVSDEAWTRIDECRAMIQEKIDAHEVMYGVTTGIGEFSEVVLTPEQTRDFQKYLVYSHAAGIGDPLPESTVRGAMIGRINVHCNGHSGGRREVTQLMVDMVNSGVTPVVCEKGSVGACGDLSPMSEIALAMMGEGECFYEGERLDASEALERAGIEPVVLQARDGLAIINGSNVLTAMAALTVCESERWLKLHDITTAMTLQALNVNMTPYDNRLHELRGFSGSVATASNLRKLTDDSPILNNGDKKVQDAYSLRSTPQVVGSLRDAIEYAKSQIHIELNGVGDNPVFLVDEKRVITGANFQGSPVALPMEMVGVGLSMVAVLSERRLNRLTNPALSGGLPPFLTGEPGMNSGMMVSQYTACSLVAETRILSHPAANQSIPAAADQEDFVSMGYTTSLKTQQILDNCYAVLAIEMIAAAQALDFHDNDPSPATAGVYALIRENIDFLAEDRPLFPDNNMMLALMADDSLIQAAESVCGALE